jgi:RimJ/RimL family protein N-acetyltransferase
VLGNELLHGARLRLAAPTHGDAAIIASWYDNAEFARLYDSSIALPKTEDDIIRVLEMGRKGDRNYYFALRRLSDSVLLGLVALDEIQWNNGVAGLSIALAPEFWGQGYGTEAMQLLLRYAFLELNLHRVQLTVFEYNARALRLYHRLGFQHEGTLREFLHRDGRRYDMLIMGLLDEEWRARDLTEV